MLGVRCNFHRWPKVISAVTEKQVPYTFINGNHDTMGNLNADQLQAFDR